MGFPCFAKVPIAELGFADKLIGFFVLGKLNAAESSHIFRYVRTFVT